MEELYYIEVTTHADVIEPHWLVLHQTGTRGVTPKKQYATVMSLPEAWMILQEVKRTPANETEYTIVRA